MYKPEIEAPINGSKNHEINPKINDERTQLFYPSSLLISSRLIRTGDAHKSHCAMGDEIQEDNDGMDTRQFLKIIISVYK